MNRMTFANPWMLAALAAVAAPVVIHLLTRARARRIKFPPYRLLVEACAGQQAIHRLRQWIVLAVRCLAMAALVGAFSRPLWRAAGATEQPGQGQRVVAILDASLSMRAAQGGVSLFTRAQAETAELLRGLQPDSVAGVILAGRQARPILPALSRNLAALHQALLAAQPTMETADAAAAVALARRMLDGAGSVYVFSDFQRSNWGEVALGDDPHLQWFLRPVMTQPVANVGVVAVQVAPPQPVVGESVDVTATVFNSSPQTREPTVRLQMESVTQETGVSVPPFGTAEATFTFTLDREGFAPGTVSIGPDDLLEDNTRHFVARTQQARQVLVLSDSEASDRRSAAFFVGTALAPSEAAAPGVRVTRRHSQDADRGALEGADAFVVVCPATISSEAAEIIARRTLEGAQLICLLDGPTAPGLVGMLAAASENLIGPPFRLARPVSVAGGPGAGLATAELSGTPLRLFADAAQADLPTMRFRRYYQTQPVAGRDDEVVLRFQDGSAALSVSPAGRGTAVFVNFAVTPDGSNLAGNPLFPALLHELLRALRRAGAEAATTPGQPWQLEAPAHGPATEETQLAVTGPDGAAVDATVVSRGRVVRLALPPARAAGFYQVRDNGAVIATGAVNVDPAESDTRAVAPEELTRPGGAGGGRVTVLRREGGAVAAETGRELWPVLMAVAVAALLLEMLLLALWRRTPHRSQLAAAELSVLVSPSAGRRRDDNGDYGSSEPAVTATTASEVGR
jgi:hypothetical protein